jgi:membrane protein CcdC involved in cytochrome C biogenesis
MTREEFAKKAEIISKVENKMRYAAYGLMLILLLFLVIAQRYSLMPGIKEKNISGILIILCFVVPIIINWLCRKIFLSKNRLACQSCGAQIESAYSKLVVIQNICPRCGKNAFQKT